LRVSETGLLRRLQSKGNFQWLVRRIEQEPADKIQNLKLPGIGVVKESKRVYPQNQLAGQLLGFVGIDGQGLEGIERQYDQMLQGEPEKIITLRDAFGRPIFLRNDAAAEAREGHRLHLTIDSSLQFLSEKYLSEAIHEHHATEGVVVMMDPNSGAIRAMASYPTYNPNDAGRFRPDLRRNRVLTDAFEPGSTFKVITIASALQHNAITPQDTFDPEAGHFRIGKHTIHEAHDDIPVRHPVSPRDILVKSNNVGAAKVALKMGADVFLPSILQFGFGAKSGIDLPGESIGLIKPVQQMKGINLATMGFGQGISVTPMQLVRAYAAIANGGYLVQPHLVDKVTTPEGQTVYDWSASVTPKERILGPEVAAEVTRWLEEVPTPEGTAPGVAIPGIKIAGKTGTAQRVDSVHGGYLKGSYVSSFIGYAPSQSPQFVMLVAIHNSKPIYYGGLVAGPAWKKIALATLQPSSELVAEQLAPESSIPVPEKSVERTENINLLPDQAKHDTAAGLAKTEVSEDRGELMPSVIGFSLRDALNSLKNHRGQLRIVGSGTVISQSPPAHVIIRDETPISITLQSRP
jgi:cell division protein FtsI (penicillin-binding protein 3)